MVKSTDLLPYWCYNRRIQKVATIGYLEEMKKYIKSNGIPGSIILAVDVNNDWRCYVHDGNHRLTCALELGIEWVSVRFIKYVVDDKFPMVPKRGEDWPKNLPCGCDFGFCTHQQRMGM